MIENRHRIEKQILLGRQAVRKTSRSRSRAATLDQDEQLHSNTSNNYNAYGLPRISVSPIPGGSDVPLCVDTDAEAAYANGNSFTRTSTSNISGASTPRLNDSRSSRNPLRSPIGRRKWASALLDPSDLKASDTDSQAAKRPTPRLNNQPTTPNTFFTRFRTQSFPTLTSPFSTFHRTRRSGKESSRTSIATQAWSSDSSSEEDLTLDDRRHIHHPSTVSIGGLARTDDEGDDD